MLEEYFIKPATIDRLRGSWIAAEIEAYVAWLAGRGYSTKSIWRRVPIVFAFGQFARARGARDIAQLPAHVEVFVDDRVALHRRRTRSARPMAKEVRAVSSGGTVAGREMPPVVRVVAGWGGCRVVVAVCPPVRGCSWEGGRRAAC
jgi:hypothetical protein